MPMKFAYHLVQAQKNIHIIDFWNTIYYNRYMYMTAVIDLTLVLHESQNVTSFYKFYLGVTEPSVDSWPSHIILNLPKDNSGDT